MELPRQNPSAFAMHSAPFPEPMELDATAPATPPSLLLRHRLFPRAMAWNIQQAAAQADDALQYQHQQRYAPSAADSREQLFRTIGKWIGEQPPPPPPPPSSSVAPQPPSAVALEAAFHVMKHMSHGGFSEGVAPPPTATTPRSALLSKKRQRSDAPGPHHAPLSHCASSHRPGSGPKRCSVVDCGKIAVSKGLCRGHGGGRRCTFPGCTKCAQSRSPFCWAHGGGKRCEAPNCRRSRKTKRFCVDHIDMELTVPLPGESEPHAAASSDTESVASTATVNSTASLSPGGSNHAVLRHLPSLAAALKRPFPTTGQMVPTELPRVVTLPQSRERLWPSTSSNGPPSMQPMQVPAMAWSH
ncbi:hypothetical protein P43SY_007308 [Pythium insidiosum]|uniref:WRKY19-like zinc finger domain-containing protein n=1 Tax=Pythium insidiosum TaxID=114742 RepID=A0AAD5M991_PYTIN|nr:hypothetical protein P43SY_007308 [Pythium insidiosum]